MSPPHLVRVRDQMTTVASKHGLRAAATERRNRHAQRNPLPPKGGVEPVELPEYAEEYGRMTQPQLRKALKEKFGLRSANDCPKGKLLEVLLKREREARVSQPEPEVPMSEVLPKAESQSERWGQPPVGSKSWPKAEACIALALQHGWEATPELLDGDICELTLRRGDETLWISWTSGVLTTEPMPTYTIADRTVKLRNASAVKQHAVRAPEVGLKELEKVSSNRFFKPRPIEPKVGKLPFDPRTATDIEIVNALMGKAVSWHNRLRVIPETAQVGKNPKKIYFTEFGGERIFNFICPATGHRAFRLAALTRVSGKAKPLAKGRASNVPELEGEA